MTQRLRNWCFTWNNYPKEFFKTSTTEDQLRELFGSFKYIVIGFETSESGTEHLQGYIDFNSARTLSGIKRIHPSIHWEPRKGTWDRATNYCLKGMQPKEEWNELHEKGPNFGLKAVVLEFGIPNEQGKRTDLISLKEDIWNGTKVDSIVLENPMVYHQYSRTLNKIEDLAMRTKWRTESPQATWYWGRTGVGKSHIAFQGYNPETHYIYPDDNGWWDDYRQQETVIFNDFRGDIDYNVLLQLLDVWPTHVKRRNRQPIPFISQTIIFTSSLPPEEVYRKRKYSRDSINQLLRRLIVINITETHIDTEEGGGVILTSPLSLRQMPAALDDRYAIKDAPSFQGIERTKKEPINEVLIPVSLLKNMTNKNNKDT